MSAGRLRVLFDTEVFRLQTHGGVSRYFAALMEHLPRHGVTPRLVAPLTFNQHLRTGRTPGFVGLRAPTALMTTRTAGWQRRLLTAADRCALRLGRHDLVHWTLYERSVRALAPSVVTVHDMIPERFPGFFPGGSPHRGKRAACSDAAVIVAVSENTRRDLLALYPDLDRPVEVTHLAVDAGAFRARARGREDGTVLFVGQRAAYKNFVTFADAAARLLQERPDLRVLCAGGPPLAADELEPFRRRSCAQRVAWRPVSDDELPSVYRSAVAFVYPSLYEGFGLPILEAFACGCPVVLSDASCFPEVAAEAGEYFDPRSADALLEALRRVTGDRARRDELRRLGERRLDAFSWDRTARRTADLYRRALGLS